MPQRRGHGHPRPRDDVWEGLGDGPLTPLAVEKRGIVTIYTTVTSSGWTGGALTMDTTDQDTKTTDAATTTTDTLETDVKGLMKDVVESSAVLPTAITTAGEDASGPLVQATDSVPASTKTHSSSPTAASSTSTTATAASTTTTTASSSTGVSVSDDVATKAGIALGVLGGLFVVLALVYWLLSRRRKQLEAQQRKAADDEKLSGSDDTPVSATPAKAPRVSLRPVTGLFGNLNAAPGQANQQTNKPVTMANAPTTRRALGGGAWERPMTSESSSDRNPFGNGAQVLEDPGTPREAMAPTTPVSEASTFGAATLHRDGLSPAPRVSALTTGTVHSGRVSAITMDSATVPPIVTGTLSRSPPHSADVSPVESFDEAPVGQAITVPEPAPFSRGGGATLSAIQRRPSERRQSVRKENVPAPLDLTLPPKMPHAVPPSPAGTEFSLEELEPGQSPVASSSAAAIHAAGGPANSTVHRVQLDFKPTLDDEMSLQAGQLVRLLHEYDDGWALCIRLDRSQQGVVPRTCLSTRPVKPRTPPQGARGPPGHPPGRPRGPSVSSQRGPMRPGGPWPQSPGGLGQRPQSPNSTGNRRYGPAGPSTMHQEYRPGLEGHPQGPGASDPAPGQAY